MKRLQITITPRRQKIELLILLFSFILSMGLNIYAIIKYHTQWRELWSELFVVLLISVVLYAVTVLVRLIYWGLKKLVETGQGRK